MLGAHHKAGEGVCEREWARRALLATKLCRMKGKRKGTQTCFGIFALEERPLCCLSISHILPKVLANTCLNTPSLFFLLQRNSPNPSTRSIPGTLNISSSSASTSNQQSSSGARPHSRFPQPSSPLYRSTSAAAGGAATAAAPAGPAVTVTRTHSAGLVGISSSSSTGDEGLFRRPSRTSQQHQIAAAAGQYRYESLDYEVAENAVYRADEASQTHFDLILRSGAKWTMCFLLGKV